jgi:hypothetical protein
MREEEMGKRQQRQNCDDKVGAYPQQFFPYLCIAMDVGG